GSRTSWPRQSAMFSTGIMPRTLPLGERGQSVLEELPLDVALGEGERGAVGGGGLAAAVEPAQQVGACGVEEVVAVELGELVHQLEARGGAVALGDRYGPVQRRDRRRRDLHQ